MQTQYVTCPNCHSQNVASGGLCSSCGAMLPAYNAGPMQPQNRPAVPGADKKVLAGVLGIVLGGLGIHKFILGYNTEGIIMLAVWAVGVLFLCGIPSLVMAVIGVIEGIMYLTKSDEEFVHTYIVNKKGWF